MRLLKVIFSIAAGFLTSVLVAELVLRQLPVSMGLYRTQNHAAWPLYAYGPHQTFSNSMTWQMLHPNRGTTNNYGQVAPFDYHAGSSPLVVIGDSFIEALMNHPEDTLQGELGRIFNPMVPVYGLGFSGNSLAEYLAIARMARAEFAPVAMVFLIIDNDIKESWSNRIGHRYFNIDQGNVSEAYMPLDSSGVAQQIRRRFGDIALYRYIQVNLGFTIEGVISRRSKTEYESAQNISQESEQRSRAITEYFLATLPTAAGIPAERLVLIFDSDRERIYDPSRAPRRGVDSSDAQDFLRTRAISLGFKVVDTAPIFSAHYHQNHRNLITHRPIVIGTAWHIKWLRVKYAKY